MALQVTCVENGGNPQSASDIERLGDGHFRVRPYSEDGDGNYKFALNVQVLNSGSEPETLTLDVDWDDAEYMSSRGLAYIGSGNDWCFVPGFVQGSVVTIQHNLTPGTFTQVGLSPAYGLQDFVSFASLAERLGFQRRTVGHSEEGRAIDSFELGEGGRRFLVTARFHPYETSSSYCVEGLMAWLSTGGREQEELLSRFTFSIVPMTNPDGVHMGLCKRTAVGGVDLSHEGARGADATARTLVRLIDDLRPFAFLDLHGWMYLDQDGIHHRNATVVERFQSQVRGCSLLRRNRWRVTDVSGTTSEGAIREYAWRRHGTEAIAVSLRWPPRTVAEMRALGGPILWAFCASLPD